VVSQAAVLEEEEGEAGRDPGMQFALQLKSCLFLSAILLCLGYCAPLEEIRPPQHLGAWIVYWDGERGIQELEQNGELFDRVSLFAYELDASGNIRHAPHLKDIMPPFFALSQKKGFSPWVTLVNDLRTPNRVLLKDSNIVRQLITDPLLLNQHVKNIVQRMKEDGFAGLDLDYEGLDVSDQDNYRAFVSALSAELEHNGLGLNVLVEPRRGPLPARSTVSLTVMGYNLHGPHTGPGPRATARFISSLRKRGVGDRYNAPGIALAVGGFSWGSDGKVRQLDWTEGQRITQSAVKNGRGFFNNVSFSRQEDGSEIWFEDDISIGEKWGAAYRNGYRKVMIWKLGGNDENLFRILSAYRTLRQ